ncbi:MAG: hypothetical protein ACO3GM_03615 [Candidatus Limnocylindrus sp.]
MTSTTAHAALLAAGFLGRVALRDITAAGLTAELYAAQDGGLARFDGAVTHGATGATAFFYIYG